MRGWRGVLGGALSLVALEVLVQSGPASKAGGIFDTVVLGVQNFISPTYAFFPAKGAASFSGTSPSTSSNGQATTAIPGAPGYPFTPPPSSTPAVQILPGATTPPRTALQPI